MKKHTSPCLILLAATALSILCGCGGAQSSPEKVTQAWVEAVVAGDCDKAASYMPPDMRDEIKYECGPSAIYPIVRVRIDDVVVRESSLRPSLRRVTLVGEIEKSGIGTSDTWEFLVEEIDGKWYFLDD